MAARGQGVPGWLRVAWVLAVASMLAACAAQTPAPPQATAPQAREAVDVLVAPSPKDGVHDGLFGPTRTLAQYLADAQRKQYFALDTLYTPPPKGFEDKFLLQLKPAHAVLHLAQGVAAWHADDKGLAAGLTDGNVYVWSDWPCPGVSVPGNGGIGAMSWDAGSPYLAVDEAKHARIHVFDLRHCAQVQAVDPKSTIVSMALSPKGSWLAFVDEVHNLWVGPTAGEAKVIARLRYVNLALAFTPQEGVLMAADQGGWVTLWSPHAGKMVDQIRIPGAPFTAARFEGSRLILTPTEGAVRGFDLVRRQEVAPDDAPPHYLERDGGLYYRTFEKRLVKNVHLGASVLIVRHSPSAGALHVHDIDGKDRYYTVQEGRQIATVDAGDWVPVGLDGGAGFEAAGTRFSLADPVYATQDQTLYCRYIPEEGFFLWWRPNGSLATAAPQGSALYNPYPGSLPVREGLLADAPVAWQDMAHIENLP
ncbi:MAG: WD40 repeat domain-containing protein [Desulfovibrionaceae bacterium]